MRVLSHRPPTPNLAPGSFGGAAFELRSLPQPTSSFTREVAATHLRAGVRASGCQA
jgi:hypothetical protein